MCAGHFCRLLDLCIGRIQPAIADIFPDRSGKQVRILQHYCDITAQVFSSNLADIHARAEALEFAIHDTSAVTDIPLAELKLKSNLLIGSINRKGKTWIPRGQDTIQVGDTVIIVTTQKGLGDILDILRK